MTTIAPQPTPAPFVTEIACRACGHGELAVLHEFGPMALANGIVDHSDDEAPKAPLTLAHCPSCTLVQILETVPPSVLFGHYAYFSSFATSTVAYAQDLAATLIQRHRLGPQSLVMEVASNDGYLLRPFVDAGVPVLGIEPARNIAAHARGQGVPTECAFFGRETARLLAAEGRTCDLLIANNVLAHVADLPGFVDGIATCLKPGGWAVMEFPYVLDMIEDGSWDTIYHEHLCYFSLQAIQQLLAAAGLGITNVERLERHGGSLRVTAKRGEGLGPPPRSVEVMLALERGAALHRTASFDRFVAGVRTTCDGLRDLVRERRAQGRTLAAYGASAKGSTLLQACGLTREEIAFVADRSPHKQDRYTPAGGIPIVPPETILDRLPDDVLLLTWNFADEILDQQREFRRLGGKFIVPVPRVKVL